MSVPPPSGEFRVATICLDDRDMTMSRVIAQVPVRLLYPGLDPVPEWQYARLADCWVHSRTLGIPWAVCDGCPMFMTDSLRHYVGGGAATEVPSDRNLIPFSLILGSSMHRQEGVCVPGGWVYVWAHEGQLAP